MKRFGVYLSDELVEMLKVEREKTNVPTSRLIAKLLDKYFTKKEK